MSPRGLSLDVGCGFRDTNTPIEEADVSLDLNLDKASPQFLSRLKNLIIADAERIPLRNGMFSTIHCKDVLEHLPNPFNAIREERRVLVEKGVAFIIIPISILHEPPYLKLLFSEFPFSLFFISSYIRFYRKYMSIRGVPHLCKIKPKQIIPFFRKYDISFMYTKHQWFVRRWGSILKKILGREIRGRKNSYLIRCVK